MPIRKQTQSQLAFPPRGILFSPPKHGKSTQLANAFPTWRWYMTEPTVLAAAEDAGLFIPPDRFELVDEFELRHGDRVSSETNWDDWFLAEHRRLGKLATKRREAGKPPTGYVLSDASTLFDWMYRDICAKIPSKGRGMFTRVGRIKLVLDQANAIAKAAGFGFVWEMHKTEITFEEPDKDGVENPRAGEVKWPGGAKFPVGSLGYIIGRSIDFIWELGKEPGDDGLILYTHPDKNELGGTRRRIEPEIKLTDSYTLRDVMRERRFAIPGRPKMPAR